MCTHTAGPSPTLALCALLPGGHPLPAEWGARPQLRDRDGAPGERGGSHRPHPQPGGGIRESCGGGWPRRPGVGGLPCCKLTLPVPTAGRRGGQRGAAAVPEAPCPRGVQGAVQGLCRSRRPLDRQQQREGEALAPASHARGVPGAAAGRLSLKPCAPPQAPDMSSSEEFPSFGAQVAPKTLPWGPKR